MTKAKLKKGDEVIVIKGKDKKKIGEILKVMPNTNKALVKDVNVRLFNIKPKTSGKKGTQERRETPIDLSNLELKE